MRILWLCSVLTLTACTSTPTSHAPSQFDENLPAAWQSPEGITGNKTAMLDLVSGAALEPLLDKALNQNPSLRQSILSLAGSGWSYEQVKAEKLPTIQLGSSASRQRSDDLSTSNRYGLTLTTSWEADIWGRISDKINAEQLSFEAQSSELEYAKRSLAANVIKAWLNWLNAQRLLENERARLSNLNLTEGVIKQRYIAGIGKIEELDTARADLEQAKAAVARQKQSVVEKNSALRLLLGSLKSTSAIPVIWPEIKFPEVSVPADALGGRPDLQAAYLKIKAADSQTRVAYKNLLPQFSITADLSRTVQSTGDLLSGDPVWQLLGQLTQPIFNGDALKHQAKIAELNAEQAYWAYKAVLLAAIVEVEDALSNERALAHQSSALSKAYEHAVASEQYIQKRYRDGLADIQNLLNAKRTTFDVRAQLYQATLSRAVNRIDLALSLGLPIQQGT